MVMAGCYAGFNSVFFNKFKASPYRLIDTIFLILTYFCTSLAVLSLRLYIIRSMSVYVYVCDCLCCLSLV